VLASCPTCLLNNPASRSSRNRLLQRSINASLQSSLRESRPRYGLPAAARIDSLTDGSEQQMNLHRQPCFSLLTRAASSRASTCQSMVAQFPDNPPSAQFRMIEPSENTTL
jgi:hypothetical protein